jgi:NodT family efflux transporter outer membrane factor (OMF) lipoprotein
MERHTTNLPRRGRPGTTLLSLALLVSFVVGLCGCTSVSEYVRNGFKVGPNYSAPNAPVAPTWIDAKDPKVRLDNPDLAAWWCTFDDPVLNDLVQRAYNQNLTLRAAGLRILEARYQRAIAFGNIFPQTQAADAHYTHTQTSGNTFGANGKRVTFDDWGTSLNLSWELDFWGKFRRAVESADAILDAAAADYDDVLVILLSEVAATYVQMRTLQKRLDLARKNVDEQVPMVKIMEQRFKADLKDSLPDYNQLKSNLDQTRSLIPQLETSLRVANNLLCILLGTPPRDMLAELGDGTMPDPADKTKTIVRIPKPKDETVVVGIPAESLLNRPDVRRAERQLAAQSAQIGVAEAEFYPHISFNGDIGLEASQFGKLFNSLSWTGSIGPSLSWNILNYGRLLANVRFQDAKTQELAVLYQNSVLTANQDAENALVGYLKALDRAKYLQDSADSAIRVTKYLLLQKEKGFGPDFGAFINRLFTAQNFKVSQQDAAAQAEGDIALNLILLYRALGGGWQIRNGAGCANGAAAPPPAMPEGENNSAKINNKANIDGPRIINGDGDAAELSAPEPIRTRPTLLAPVVPHLDSKAN